jgi:PAS domain S-box-containing protein
MAATFSNDPNDNAAEEQILRDNEALYRNLFEHANDAITIMEGERFINCNKKAEALFGAPREQIIGKTPGDFSPRHQADGSLSEAAAREKIEAVHQGKPQFFEWVHQTLDGQPFNAEVSLNLSPVRDRKIVQAIVRDVSSRKEHEKALRESRQMLRTVIDTVPVRVFWKDLDLKYLGCNRPFAADAGLGHPDEVVGRTDFDMGWSDQAELYRQDDREVIQSRQPKLDYEEARSTPEGKKIWLKTSKVPLMDSGGKPIGVLGTYEDITEKKRAEQVQRVFYGIGNTMMHSENMESLIQKIRELLEGLIDAPNFYIALYDESSGMLSIPYEKDEKDSIDTWPAHRSATGLVVEQKKSLLLKKADVERLLKEDVIDLIGTPSEVWLGVPLFSKDKVIGAIALQSYTDPHAFDENTIQILEFVSHQISLAIQRKQAEKDLVGAKEQAEQNDRLKTAFLNNLSHEIRTPLNAIIGFSEFLNEPGLDPGRIAHLTDIICKSSNQLLGIIEDIVNISKIEAGIMEAWEKETNLKDLFASVYNQLQISASEKGLRFRHHLDLNESQAMVRTDETKLTQVISNLVDNAIKFTDQGHVEFGCTLKDGELRFYVADTGPGIDPSLHDKIFERFHQAETGHAHTKGGMGLGLPISKSFVDLLGGRIWLESKPGSGTVFFFTLPWKPAAGKRNEETGTEAASLKVRKTILVAEDEENNFELARVILSIQDVALLHAWNGQEAVDLCRDHPEIDLVLMDIKMPGMNGYDATRIIREIRPALPVIAMTAYALPGDREKALQAGCNDYLAKPVSLKEFMTMVKKHL